jgi:hypothetical protein
MSKSGATTKPVQSVATERLTVGRALALTVTENDARRVREGSRTIRRAVCSVSFCRGEARVLR